MNDKFDELAKGLDQSLKRSCALKKFGLGFAGLMLACFGLANVAQSQTSVISDPAGDAVFPTDLYGAAASVPPYLDIVQASVSYSQGTFHFEIKMNGEIPANPAPGFSPSVNHLGATVGVLTDSATAGTPFKFIGQTEVYHFNFLVGALYSFADDGLGLGLGWKGFLIDNSTFTAVEIPLEIRGDTLVFETSAASLGNPASFNWGVATECDPVPIPQEKTQTTLLVDFAPDHELASWPAQ